jgi:hypothetical protein
MGMMQKHSAVTMINEPFQTHPFGAYLRQIITKLASIVEVPVGYEDETGFHLGSEPAE